MTAGEYCILWVELGLQISAEDLFQCNCKSSDSAQNNESQVPGKGERNVKSVSESDMASNIRSLGAASLVQALIVLTVYSPYVCHVHWRATCAVILDTIKACMWLPPRNAQQECYNFFRASCAHILLVLTSVMRNHDVASVHNTILLIQPHTWHEICPCL